METKLNLIVICIFCTFTSVCQAQHPLLNDPIPALCPSILPSLNYHPPTSDSSSNTSTLSASNWYQIRNLNSIHFQSIFYKKHSRIQTLFSYLDGPSTHKMFVAASFFQQLHKSSTLGVLVGATHDKIGQLESVTTNSFPVGLSWIQKIDTKNSILLELQRSFQTERDKNWTALLSYGHRFSRTYSLAAQWEWFESGSMLSFGQYIVLPNIQFNASFRAMPLQWCVAGLVPFARWSTGLAIESRNPLGYIASIILQYSK